MIGLAGFGAWTYLLVRQRHLRWGVFDEDAARDLPGDDHISHPQFEVTRGVLIDAPHAAVWPWLVQMGSGRAGYYSYDRIDNKGRPSARKLVPGWQEIAVGDLLAAPGEEGFVVAGLEPERHFVLAAMGERFLGIENDTTIAYILDQAGPDRTRLLCRMRIAHTPSIWGRDLTSWLIEPGDFVMMRRQLLGIRERAEA